jgi:putative Mn2+ efflux pump MntP
MQLDVRLPIGLMFSLFGVILAVLGLVKGSEQSQRLLGLNLNLAWGLVILAFGLVMLVFALRGRKKHDDNGPAA